MKRFIFFLLLIPLFLNAQNDILYGYAGQNSADNYTTEVRKYINEMVPAGGSFIADYCQYKYTGKGTDIGIQNMIDLRDELLDSGKYFFMIYSFDARAKLSLADNFYAFDKFITAGINLVASRCGNEEWAKVAHNGNWSLYMSHCTPILNELTAKGFPGKVIFPIRRPAEAGTWNASAITFINSNPNYEPDCHPYYNGAACPVLDGIEEGRALPQELTNANNYLLSKDLFYKDLYDQVTASAFYDEFINYHRENFPGKKLWITEFGPAVGVGPISGALGYEASFDWFLNKINKDADIVAAVCRFNGPGITGSITPVSKKDAATVNKYIKRTGYYTYKQFLHNRDAVPVQLISAPGEYTFSIHNMTRGAIDFEGYIPLASGLEISAAEYECITGTNYYSSSGATDWWATGSDKTYEISGSGFYNYIPAISYGYVHVTVNTIEIPGCTNLRALNYNPDANSDDGSCYYQEDCKCQDPLATNYDPDAPCFNNELCTYPEPEKCMKKRWLFSGCKEAKSNCNCN